MSSAQPGLDAAATDRKARLAKLASLKRKQPGSDTTVSEADKTVDDTPNEPSKTDVFLSGRNYDVATRGPKLGFENTPSTNHETVEQQAQQISDAAAVQAAEEAKNADEGIDLFKLQPQKRNWDLKRDLAEKMRAVDVKTQNAIARLVRERIEKAKAEALQKGKGHEKNSEEGEEVGVEGTTLVEAVHLREREEAAAEQREKELDDNDDVP